MDSSLLLVTYTILAFFLGSLPLSVWIGLTIWSLSLPALGFLIFWRLVVWPPGWALLLALASMALVIAIWFPDPVFLIVLALQSPILLFKERSELQQRPSIKRQKQ
jgi:hypothetical protein